MGTRSNIGIVNDDDTVTLIYCHWDGYPENNGKILLQNYQDEEKIRQLLAIGDLSQLGPEIGEKTPFNDPAKGQCVAYGRDRGEDGVEARHFNNPEQARSNMEEYLYLWNEGRWVYSDQGGPFQVLLPTVCGGGFEIEPVVLDIEVTLSDEDKAIAKEVMGRG